AYSNEEVKVIPFNPGERALRRLRRKGRDFRGLSGGSLLLTLRGMFFSYFSDTRELNTVVAKLYPLKMSQMPLYAVGVVPARRQPQPGRISALAGRRAAYERVPDN
ncbi:TPA: hypothetical protein ACWYK9_004845, partial [Escherichia coli]